MADLRTKQKALSLVEICIVCFILIILLVPIFTLLSRGSSGTVRNRNEILAQQYASNVIAYCNAMKYDDEFLKVENGQKTKEIKKLEITGIENQENINIELPKELGETASKTITITDFDKKDDWPFSYKLVTVKVVWLQPGETKARELTMTGMVTKQ